MSSAIGVDAPCVQATTRIGAAAVTSVTPLNSAAVICFTGRHRGPGRGRVRGMVESGD
jgi:hypothetical protein